MLGTCVRRDAASVADVPHVSTASFAAVSGAVDSVVLISDPWD